jgi:hypothetical protein
MAGTNGSNGGTNGSSYQKDGIKYESIPIEEGGTSSQPGGNKKSIFLVIIAVIIGAIGVSLHKSPGAATDAAVAKANLPKGKSGKLKLFDEHSKYCTIA